MRILVVEDDRNKCLSIIEFLRDEVPKASILQARSYTSAMRMIVHESIDLVILDMTLPTYDVTPSEDGGRTRAYAGRDILREMKRFSCSARAIVITQFERFYDAGEEISFDELEAQLASGGNDLYGGMIYYHAAQADWREKLSLILRPHNLSEEVRGAAVSVDHR